MGVNPDLKIDGKPYLIGHWTVDGIATTPQPVNVKIFKEKCLQGASNDSSNEEDK